MIDKPDVDAVMPFAGLSPDVVLDAAASLGFEGDGRLFALNSYENRVYQMGRPEGALVLKFYRPGRWTDAQIAEEHQFTEELAAAEMAVAAPLNVDGRTLFRYRGLSVRRIPLAARSRPELDAPESRQLLGRALARLHRIGAVQPFRTRLKLSVDRLGLKRVSRCSIAVFSRQTWRSRISARATRCWKRIERVFDEVGPTRQIRLHGDCHLGRFVVERKHGPVFVDLDDCMTGPAIQDLWMLLSGPAADQQRQWRELTEGYEHSPCSTTARCAYEPFRGLRMLHHAAWLATRWSDPAFPRAFPWFGGVRYWEEHVNDLLAQAAAVDDPPLLNG